MPASRFHDGLHGATYIVRPFVFGRQLRIVLENDVAIAVWKLSDVRAAPEVDPDGVVTFTAQDRQGVLLVDDKAELEILAGAGIRLPGRKAWSRHHWVAAIAGVAAVVVLGIVGLNTLPRWIAAAIPISWEQRLGGPAEAMMTASKPRCTGKEGQAALDQFVARLRTAGDIEIPVTLSVIDDRTINAYTLPGGHVLVMRGLIGEAADGTVLAGVIAHELGHVAHRDSTTLLVRQMGFSIVLYMIGLGDVGNTAASGASNLMSLAYSRAAEAAADATAVDLLTKAGLRADGLSRFFEQMEQRAKDKGLGGVPGWLATHPPSEERRERTVRPATGEMPFTDAEWQSIKAMCARK